MNNSDAQFKKLMKGLKKFPANIQKNVMNGAIRSSAVEIQKEAKENVPFGTGNLRDSIVVIKGRTKDKSKTIYKVALKYTKQKDQERSVSAFGVKVITQNKAGGADGYYGSMVEYGTEKQDKQPFMRPALMNKHKSSIETARRYIAKRLPKEASKIKGG